MGRIICVAFTLAIAHCLIDAITCEYQILGDSQALSTEPIFKDKVKTASNKLQVKTATINFSPKGMVIEKSGNSLLY